MQIIGTKIKLTKLEAARRQLQTAIKLWFADDDPVSVHTLAFAAYEVLHAVSKKINPTRKDLLFDSLIVKDEYRKEWNDLIKKPGNFFKHARNDADQTIEFDPNLSEAFLLYAIAGVAYCKETLNDEESVFMLWFGFHNPDVLTGVGRKRFIHGIPVNELERIRAIPKHDFFEAVMNIRRRAKR